MFDRFSQIHLFAWVAWFLYWRVAANDTKTTARRDTAGSRLAYFLLLAIGVQFFWLSDFIAPLRRNILPPSLTLYWGATALLFAGLAFAVWARLVLGRNWSNAVTMKEDHELIQTGPYRWVRHPIYTGILAGLLGSALAQDRIGSLVAVAVIAFSFWIKLRREEQWMRELFGETYVAYSRRTKRLIPFLL